VHKAAAPLLRFGLAEDLERGRQQQLAAGGRGGRRRVQAQCGRHGRGAGRRRRRDHLVPGVGAHVPGDHVPAARGVRTLRTLVRFFAGVRALVGAQVVGPREHLAAHATSVRLDARVQSHVPGEHVAARKRPVAHLARVRLGRAAGRVAAAAAAAVLGRRVRRRPGAGRRRRRRRRRFVPGRHVLGQPIVQAEHLSAHRTHVRHVRADGHLLDDGRHFQVVPDGHRSLGGARRHVALDHRHGVTARATGPAVVAHRHDRRRRRSTGGRGGGRR